jgi:endonuclease/exonuclease/phosphatase family metal-dependent hydrolase
LTGHVKPSETSRFHFGSGFFHGCMKPTHPIRRLLLPALACLCLASCLASCRRARALGPPKAVPVAADGSLELRLATFNLRYENHDDDGPRAWRRRITHIVRMIREEQTDVLGIQEAMHGQAADLWASLPDFEFFGHARGDGARNGEYAGIFFRHDRFEPDRSDRGTFWLSDTPETPGSATWGNTIPRTATWLRLTDRASQRSFYVFNTHWDHRGQPSRLRAADLLATRINQRRHPQEPVVLLGDFNALPHNPAIRSLTTQTGLVESLATANQKRTASPTLHFWRGSAAGPIQVDHIFVSPEADVLSARIRNHDQPFLSDHFPVTAHIIFP